MADTVIGVIAVPTHGETFVARLGGGVTLNGAPLNIPPETTLRNAVTAIGTSQHSDPDRIGALTQRLLRAGGISFNNGSGALMLAYVAAGRMAGCYADYMNAWDCLAGLLMVREAGGRTAPFRPDGDLGRPDRVLAAAPAAWDELNAMLAAID